MELYRCLSILCCLLAILRSNAFKDDKWQLSNYWHSALPHTKLPKSLQNTLQLDEEPIFNSINVKTILQRSAVPTLGNDDNYAKAASEKVQLIEPDVTMFFLQNDLHSGKKMKLHFPKSTNQAKFLPRKVSESIPFSTTKLPEILNRFGIQPKSVEAETLRQTIEECEQAGIEGEDKYCATSLEAMVEFSVSKLGNKNINVLSIESDKGISKQVYSIVDKGVKKIGDRSVICHKQKYAYAVFYCHEIKATKTYTVSMVGNDGTKAKAVAVCHTDTRTWNHDNFAFQLLKIKPGTVPICHFLNSDTLVWVQTSN
ncbi:BURP domain-containing protein 3 [Ziziphus jujuba]|uniref:BURP domain-containing protein n=2 Tax=Ziziphus jujuba TaxID=326968 RepID=A0A978U9P7_ZIZJJ|nr:BURP domain-containing protein 3-like [Ziziphus jujuba var. spinosa]XP_048322244.1 BURP domain-containing protein 3-like [Ziziphus jujuba var. spinosa]XP_048322377.2 BURP domain-containing protein 3 [Ziziphus jujuba]KAH7511327.1 hypothetical protein FEM48_ZijujUnG0023500 [Ziziphus jujuba var. spinosa]KAH7542223.1 hypothetical protein FEM48_Zijuj02G0050700 [Ziziphus jujuba var. spinosa]